MTDSARATVRRARAGRRRAGCGASRRDLRARDVGLRERAGLGRQPGRGEPQGRAIGGARSGTSRDRLACAWRVAVDERCVARRECRPLPGQLERREGGRRERCPRSAAVEASGEILEAGVVPDQHHRRNRLAEPPAAARSAAPRRRRRGRPRSGSRPRCRAPAARRRASRGPAAPTSRGSATARSPSRGACAASAAAFRRPRGASGRSWSASSGSSQLDFAWRSR